MTNKAKVVGGPGSIWQGLEDELVEIPFPEVEMDGEIQWLIKPGDPPLGSSGAPAAAAIFDGRSDVKYSWTMPYDEVIVLIEGEGTVTVDGDPPRRLVVGSSSFVSKGSLVTYDFPAPFKEMFFVFL